MITGKSATRLLLSLILLPQLAQADGFSLPQLMELFNGVEQRSASYTEQQTLPLLDVPLESHGRLLFRAPDRLEKQVADGGGSYRVAGQMLEVEQDGVLQRIALDSYPALAAFVASFRATLAGDQQTLERYYNVTLEGDARGWVLTLLPTERNMAALVRRITLHGSGNRIGLIESVGHDGGHSRMQLREQHEE